MRGSGRYSRSRLSGVVVSARDDRPVYVDKLYNMIAYLTRIPTPFLGGRVVTKYPYTISSFLPETIQNRGSLEPSESQDYELKAFSLLHCPTDNATSVQSVRPTLSNWGLTFERVPITDTPSEIRMGVWSEDLKILPI